MDDSDFKAQVAEFLAVQRELAENKDKLKAKPHPYCSETFAKAAQKIINCIIQTKHSHIIALKGTNAITAKIQWYQGCKYLLKNLDPTKTYVTALEKIGCRAVDGDLHFYIKSSITPDISTIAATEAAPWKEDFLLWIDKPDKKLNEKFPCPAVTLSEADIEWAYQQMAGLETLYLYKFTEHEVIAIRYDNTKE